MVASAVRTRAEPDAAHPTTGPRRRCFVTRREADKSALIRFVVGPGDEVLADVAGTLPGRGLWLSADRDVVHTASAKNLFAKGFRAKVSVGAGLADRIERLLARRCLDLLGLARRAGAGVAGFEKVRALVASGDCGVLVIAADAGADGRRKLGGGRSSAPVVSLFTAAEIGASLGRDHAVYVAVRKGRMADRFAAEATRLAGFRRLQA
ncbi:MAG: RNA-binding protein [Alphaproteobacteria bacterium]